MIILATPNILTKNSIKELKQRVNEELSRREYYGNISSAAPDYDTPNSNDIAKVSEINDNVIDKLNLINNKLDQETQNNPIRYSYINTQLTTFESNSNSNTGCRQACTGFCSSTCANGCQGQCGQSCSKGCGSSSGGSSDYVTECGSCGSSCGNSCGSCGGSCAEGCTGCGSGCSEKCATDCGSSTQGNN